MSYLQAAAIGASVLSTGAGLFGGSKAKKEQKQAAERNAKFVFRQRMEEIRRAERDIAINEGEALAKGYASNVLVKGGGSTASYLRDLRNENASQLQFAKSGANVERDTILENGASPGYSTQQIGVAAGGIANVLNLLRTTS